MAKIPLDLKFPLGGLNRRFAFSSEPPFTAVDAKNVRPRGTLKGRKRGGSRPGLVKAFPTRLGLMATGTLSADPVPANGVWPITNGSGIFNEKMVGMTVNFTETDNDYTIVEYTSATVVQVSTDASGEWDSTDKSMTVYGGPVNMLTTLRDLNVTKATSWVDGFDVPEGPLAGVWSEATGWSPTNGIPEVVQAGNMEGWASNKSMVDASGTQLGGIGYHPDTNRSTLVATQNVFLQEMVGSTLTYDSSSAPFPIAIWISGTVVVLIGDARGESDGNTFSINYKVPATSDSAGPAAVTRAFLDFDLASDQAYELQLGGQSQPVPGKYYLYFAMDDLLNLNTASVGNGIEVVLDLTDPIDQFGGTYNVAGKITSYVNGSAASTNFTSGLTAAMGLFRAEVNAAANTVDVKLHETTLVTNFAIPAALQSNKRFGFGLLGLNGARIAVDHFRFKYSPVGGPEFNRNRVVASAGGKLYIENTSTGDMDLIGSDNNYQITKDYPIQAVDWGGKLYIADHGKIVSGTTGQVDSSGNTFTDAAIGTWTDKYLDSAEATGGSTAGGYNLVIASAPSQPSIIGRHAITSVSGTDITASGLVANTTGIAYWIERVPKVYDPKDDKLLSWDDDVGLGIPIGCSALTVYNDRMVLAGQKDAPQVWYMSRLGDPNDWDFADATDGRAVAGTNLELGKMPQPITSVFPIGADVLCLTGLTLTYLLVGDPTFGGALQSIDRQVGAVGNFAWSHGAQNGGAFMLTRDGIYSVSNRAQSLTREVVPNDLLNINADLFRVSLAYDAPDRGLHIFVTAVSGSSGQHYWVDAEEGTMWPMAYQSDHDPFSVAQYQANDPLDSAVLLGCRDGYIRRHSSGATGDDGTAVSSFVYYGPLLLGGSAHKSGRVLDIQGVLGDGSSSVNWDVFAGDSPEEAFNASSSSSGTWTSGPNKRSWPKTRGNSSYIKLSGSSSIVQLGSLLSVPTYDSATGLSTVTAAAGTFTPEMVGGSLVFTVSSASFVVQSYVDSSAIRLTGDASGEANKAEFSVTYTGGTFLPWVIDRLSVRIDTGGRNKIL